jgi:PAS domain S-box-containing protein
MEAAPDAMVISDFDGRILLVNAQTEKLFGYSREELLGQAIEVLVPERFRRKHPGHRVNYTALPRTRSMGEGLDLWGLRKDSTEFAVEISLSPIETAEGTLITSAIRDVTARKSAEKALRASEIKFRGILESAPDAMIIADAQGHIVLVNAETERLFGYRRGELIGQAVEILVPERFRGRHPQHRREYTAHPRTRSMGEGFDLSGLRKDNTEFAVEISLSPIETPEGTLISSAIRDVTARKEAQEILKHREALERRSEELKRSNDELQEFAYVAAHDLQEPLRMVASYTQLLAQRYKGRLDSDADEFIAYAVDGAQRMQLLIRDLLAYCRVGTTGKDLRETSSADALEQALLNLQGAIQESGGVVTHDPLPTVIADGAQLVQLFQNVVGNAIKYRRKERPRVHVSAKKNGGSEWIFSMQDNGIGIDPQYYEKIFVMFQRLHGRDEFSGTGIGLTLCKKIAERHGGRMWVESNPGQGSTFYFALPERVMT